MKHDCAGVLTSAKVEAGKNTNASQFMVTLAAAPQLDGKHVAFGKVVSGMEVLREIEACGAPVPHMPTDIRTRRDSGKLIWGTEVCKPVRPVVMQSAGEHIPECGKEGDQGKLRGTTGEKWRFAAPLDVGMNADLAQECGLGDVHTMLQEVIGI